MAMELEVGMGKNSLGPDVLGWHRRVLLLEKFDRGYGQVELVHEMLREHSDAHFPVLYDVASSWLKLSRQQLQECRFL